MKLYHRLEDMFFAREIKKFSREKELWAERNLALQKWLLKQLISHWKETIFWNHHRLDTMDLSQGFHHIYENYKRRVSVEWYEYISAYIEEIKQWTIDVLRPWQPKYLATTSGTTSGKKYIPVSFEWAKMHIDTWKEAIVSYLSWLKKKPRLWVNYFLSWTPILSENWSAVPHWRLSWIVHNETPALIRYLAQSPSRQVNAISNFEEKIERTVEEHLAIKNDITLISGIPSYFSQYAEILLKKTNKNTLKEVFPNLSMMVTGWVNLAPYKETLRELLWDDSLGCIETYPASEWFIAYQDNNFSLSDEHEWLLLKTDWWIFYEFVPVGEVNSPENRHWLWEVSLWVTYSIILTTNSWLWWYELWDLIEFTSLNPFRIKVVGRTKNWLSAFWEHVIQEEIDALQKLWTQVWLPITNYTVTSYISDKENYHERFIECDRSLYWSLNDKEIAKKMDNELQKLNEYYRDLRDANRLQVIKIHLIKPGSCRKFLESRPWVFDPQMKRLCSSEDRTMAEFLLKNNCNWSL